jgi:hypothetical protein
MNSVSFDISKAGRGRSFFIVVGNIHRFQLMAPYAERRTLQKVIGFLNEQ